MSTLNHRQFPVLRILAVYGCVATGVIYFSIGLIAMLSFLRLRDGGADEGSAMAILDQSIAGRILVWTILAGLVGYVICRIAEAIMDPYEYGTSWRAMMVRVGIALSTIADLMIVNSSIRVLFGLGEIQNNGVPVEERRIIATLLDQPYGAGLTVTLGVIVLITALVQFHYGFTNGYEERIVLAKSKAGRYVTRFLGWLGYAGRGIILGIIGWFLIMAGVQKESELVVNTDKAFDLIGDDVGAVAFIAVALSTICYGIFMFLLAHRYRIGRMQPEG